MNRLQFNKIIHTITLFAFFLFPVSLISCYQEKTIENKELRTINLHNNIGKIEINIPIELDTFKTSIHISDYKCGDKFSYIFLNKNDEHLIVDTTAEFAYNPNRDLEMSFTISQPLHYVCDEYSDLEEEFLDRMASNITGLNKNSRILKKEYINNLLILGYTTLDSDSNLEILNIDAWTVFNNHLIEFNFMQRNNPNNKKIFSTILDCLNGIELTD